MTTPHSDRYVEKRFLYIVASSLALHAVIIAICLFLPEQKKAAKEEPVMIDFQDFPSVMNAQSDDKRAARAAEEKNRVFREMAPKGEEARDNVAPQPARATPTLPSPPARVEAPAQARTGMGGISDSEPLGGESIRKPKAQGGVDPSKLFPSPSKMASLEDIYRKKYGPEVETGETKFLNTEDILFGSFMRRFEAAVYGVWRYPQEAITKGVQGGAPVRITFNRSGEITTIKFLETSGSKILDEEVFRTLRSLGPLGTLPKGYNKDEFNLVVFFRYSIVGGVVRGMLN